jgi:hypothetical protein
VNGSPCIASRRCERDRRFRRRSRPGGRPQADRCCADR